MYAYSPLYVISSPGRQFLTRTEIFREFKDIDLS